MKIKTLALLFLLVFLSMNIFECFAGNYEFIKFKENNKLGLKNLSGKVVVKPVYEEIGFSFNKEGLLKIKRNGKYGFINKSLKEKIAPQYDKLEGFSGGTCIVTINHKQALINEEGQFIVKPGIYDRFMDPSINSDRELFYVCKGSKIGAINKNGKLIIPIIYKKLSFKTNGGRRIVDEKNQTVLKLKYPDFSTPKNDESIRVQYYNKTYKINENCFIESVENKYGIVDNNHNWILEPKYDYLQKTINESFLKCNIGGKWNWSGEEFVGGKCGVIDIKGSEIVRCEYSSISVVKCSDNINTLAFHGINEKTWYLFDSTGTEICSYDASKIIPKSKIFALRENNQISKIFNYFGNEVFNYKNYTITSIEGSTYSYIIAKNNKTNKYVLINELGDRITNYDFDRIFPVYEEVNGNLLIEVQYKGKYNLINLQGTFLTSDEKQKLNLNNVLVYTE